MNYLPLAVAKKAAYKAAYARKKVAEAAYEAAKAAQGVARAEGRGGTKEAYILASREVGRLGEIVNEKFRCKQACVFDAYEAAQALEAAEAADVDYYAYEAAAADAAKAQAAATVSFDAYVAKVTAFGR
jgi:HD-like signal output (HDOD) protein